MKEMKKFKRLFTSECVTQGHPDSLADYIADSILTEMLKQDPKTRAGIEVLNANDHLILAGEVTTNAVVDREAIAREAIRNVGYIYKDEGCLYNADDVIIEDYIHQQSADIALGTNDGATQFGSGAGDQGIVFGAACCETSDYMPLPITMARDLCVRVEEIIANQEGDPEDYFRPDAKSQVTLAYAKDNQPMYVDTVVLSISHKDGVDMDELREKVKAEIIAPSLKSFGFDINDVLHTYINPTGKFSIYGPTGDSGLTGRKLVCDNYGGMFEIGGGATHGKDFSKTDRSAAHMARKIAKTVVAANLADKVEVQIGYAIGVAKPVSINVNCFGTQHFPVGLICKAINNTFDCTPFGIKKEFGIFDKFDIDLRDTVTFGQYGEFAPEVFPWEALDRVDELREYVEKNYIPQ